MGSKKHWTNFRHRAHSLAFNKALWLAYTLGNPHGPRRADGGAQTQKRKAKAQENRKNRVKQRAINPPRAPTAPGAEVHSLGGPTQSIADLAAVMAAMLAAEPALLAAVVAALRVQAPVVQPHEALPIAVATPMSVPEAAAEPQLEQEEMAVPEVMAVAEPLCAD